MDEKDRLIAELQKQVETLTSTVKELQEIIQELRRQLNQDSHNSSKPPSSDGFKRPRTKSLRKHTGKKQGGQPGHPGSHMSIPHAPDEVKQHIPEQCQTCPHLLACRSRTTVFRCAEKRYEVNARITTYVTEHQSLQVCDCPCGASGSRGKFPDKIRAYVQYGDSVTVLAGILNTYGAVSIERIHILLSSLLGVRVSTGTIASMLSRCAKTVGPAMKIVHKKLQCEDVVNFDETGADVAGKTLWVHNASTEKLTYQTLSEKRGQVGMDEGGILPHFTGIAVHDCWSPYWKYDGVTHAVCNAHLLRELTGIAEQHPEHTWAEEMIHFLCTTKILKEMMLAKGEQRLDEAFLHQYVDLEFDEILGTANSQCPPSPVSSEKKKGRKKKGKERALIERLQKLKGSVCLFVHKFVVPFDNNQAERDLRNVKTKNKVSGCFRTKEGAQNYLDVMSFLSTARKHGHNVFEALTAAFAGDVELIFQ